MTAVAGKQPPEQVEIMLWRMDVWHLVLYVTIKGGDLRGYIKSIGDRLGRWKKTKWKNLWDWITSKMERYILL